jgi:hypothetical protein
MYAYLDTNGCVLATSTTDRTLAEVNAKPLGGTGVVTEKIAGAPEVLLAAHALIDIQMPAGKVYLIPAEITNMVYHEKVSGDGTNIGDYQVVDDVRGHQVWFNRKVDTMTWDNQDNVGFTYNSIVYSLSSYRKQTWIGLMTASLGLTLTYPFMVRDMDCNKQFLTSDADVAGFYGTGMTRVNVLANWAANKQALCNADTTHAEIEAIDISDMP